MLEKETLARRSDAYQGTKVNRNREAIPTEKCDRVQAIITASNWRLCERGMMVAFVDLELPSGLKLIGCTYHASGSARWVGLPGRPQLDHENRARICPKTGKISYAACVAIEDYDARERFKRQALEAIDVLRAKGGAE